MLYRRPYTFNERLFAVVDGEAVQLLYLSRVGFALAVTAHGERVLRHLPAPHTHTHTHTHRHTQTDDVITHTRTHTSSVAAVLTDTSAN